jgi:hypothetical protein
MGSIAIGSRGYGDALLNPYWPASAPALPVSDCALSGSRDGPGRWAIRGGPPIVSAPRSADITSFAGGDQVDESSVAPAAIPRNPDLYGIAQSCFGSMRPFVYKPTKRPRVSRRSHDRANQIERGKQEANTNV